MLKYSCALALTLLVYFAKAQDTITIELNKDSITPQGCLLHIGHGFAYYADENQQNISTDKTVKPGLYNIENKYGLVAKVRHISKNENIIYYYGQDSIVRKIVYEPYFEITLTKYRYESHESDYQMSSIHIYDNDIRLIDFSYRNEEFYIRTLNKKFNKGFTLINFEVINQ